MKDILKIALIIVAGTMLAWPICLPNTFAAEDITNPFDKEAEANMGPIAKAFYNGVKDGLVATVQGDPAKLKDRRVELCVISAIWARVDTVIKIEPTIKKRMSAKRLKYMRNSGEEWLYGAADGCSTAVVMMDRHDLKPNN